MPKVSLGCWVMYVFWLLLSRMVLTQCFSWGCTEAGFDARELPDAGVSLAVHKLEWCHWEQFEQPRLESQFFAMWERLRQMKQRPCFLSMSFLSPMFVTTTLSIDFCLQKVHVIPCPSGANIVLKVGGEGLGGCFLSLPGTSKLPYCWASTPRACKPLIWISVLS